MPHPVPDWQRQQVFLVDPGIWNRYRASGSNLRPVYAALVEALRSLGVEPCILGQEDQPVDIWIRDWGFVESIYFKFPPSYATTLYSQKAVAKARQALDRRTGVPRRSIPLVLDGGNLVHNGEFAILTEKVLSDNPHFSRLEIERIIITLGFQRVVFIPTEPEDVIGHADGIVRFLSPGLLLVNDYCGSDFRHYRRELYSTLQKANLKVEIVPFPWFSTDEMNDGVWSAVGCYINFIQTAGGIICPTFTHLLDERAAQVLTDIAHQPLRPLCATSLARIGGVLNCISLNAVSFD